MTEGKDPGSGTGFSFTASYEKDFNECTILTRDEYLALYPNLESLRASSPQPGIHQRPHKGSQRVTRLDDQANDAKIMGVGYPQRTLPFETFARLGSISLPSYW